MHEGQRFEASLKPSMIADKILLTYLLVSLAPRAHGGRQYKIWCLNAIEH